MHAHAPNTPEKLGGIAYHRTLLRVIFVRQYVYLGSSAGVEKSLVVCFVEGITLESYLLLVQLVLVHVELISIQHVTNFLFGVRTLSGYLVHA